MYAESSRFKLILLAERQFIRTFTARATNSKRKKAKKKEVAPDVEEKADISSNTYPFCLPKEHPTLPSSPFTIPYCRMDIDDARYYKIQGESENYTFPSVTHVLSATRPRSFSFAMKTWESNMIKEHGEEGFQKMRGLIKTQGLNFHKAVGDYLLNKEIDGVQLSFQNRLQKILWRLSRELKGLFKSAEEKSKQVKQKRQTIDYLFNRLPEAEGFAKSVEHVVNDITEVYAVESMVSHINLGYVGTVDLVAKYKDEVCVIDWKTSHKPRPTLKDIYDYPLQTIAYAGAINDDKNYSFNVNRAVIVVVYKSGAPADVHMFDHQQCMGYWREWLDRLDQFQKMFAHDLNEIADE